MNAKLLAYEYVPSGFEMVIKDKMVKAWNLWWNVKLTDDPEAWDSEIKLLNELQSKLNYLSSDQRLIRAQMAEFCREHPLFPKSIDILCEEIGENRFSNPVKTGYEGRGLLDTLGHNDQESTLDLRKECFRDYKQSLEKWLFKGRQENPTDSKVHGFLGQSTKSKEAFVEKILFRIQSKELSISSLKKISEDECKVTQGTTILETRARPFNCFNCTGCPEEDSTQGCQCCYSMILDAGLLCSGTFEEQRSILEEYRRFTEENILAYSVAINSWLTEATPKHVTPLKNARYITEDNALEIPEKVHASLGEKDDVKVWLVACLLKTIKDNQRWHKRAELIDNFTEASSWFKEMSNQ